MITNKEIEAFRNYVALGPDAHVSITVERLCEALSEAREHLDITLRGRDALALALNSTEQERNEALSLVLAATYTEDGTALILRQMQENKQSVEKAEVKIAQVLALREQYFDEHGDISGEDGWRFNRDLLALLTREGGA